VVLVTAIIAVDKTLCLASVSNFLVKLNKKHAKLCCIMKNNRYNDNGEKN